MITLRTAAQALLLICAATAVQSQVNIGVRSPIPQAVQECTNCPAMVVVPAGSFTMGSPSQEAGRDADEGPQRSVNVARFAVSQYEVTRGQFAAFVADSGYQPRADNCWYYDAEEGKYKNDNPALSWRNPGFAQNDGHPVVCVSWTDAKTYADWVARKSGKPYRLLTEAEWEYAARAGSATAWAWGADPDQACRHANIFDPSFVRVVPPPKDKKWNPLSNCDDGSAYTANVGSYLPNVFGLHDMIGNVWEWTEDCWNASYAGAPTDGSAWLTGDCALRVGRGGVVEQQSAQRPLGQPQQGLHRQPQQQPRLPAREQAREGQS